MPSPPSHPAQPPRRRSAAQPAAPSGSPAVDSDPNPQPALPAVRWRWLLSGLILWQLWAVLGEPVEFMTRVPMSTSGSPFGEAFNRPVSPYSELTYLNHGYAFFAPDPGPSHLIEVRIAGEGDAPPQLETFPDLQRQWPRLLYHRHFMLTEFLHNVHTAPLPAELAEVDDAEARAWRASRRQYEAIRDSFRRHIAARRNVDVQRVTIARIEHRAPFVPEYLLDRVRLHDPRLYRELPDDLGPMPGPAPGPSPAPGPGPALGPGPAFGAPPSPEVVPAGPMPGLGGRPADREPAR